MSDDGGQGIKLLIDEDLSPWVAQRLRMDSLIDAVHVRDRDRLGSSDREVLDLAFSESRILVTANVVDFERLARARDIHGGLVLILDGGLRRAEQLSVLCGVVNILASEAISGRDMVNRVLRVSADGTTEFVDLPEQEP